MKELRLWIAAVVAAAGLASCSSAYYAASGYAGDDLYVQHDRAQIARKQQAEAEAKKAEAEARRAEWEARIAEAQAAAAENDYYEYRSADSNPYQSILADDYESAYARRLRGFESPTYRMPSSYINARYSSAFTYASAYDPAFYNVIVMGDEVWVEPKYITSMFGSWGTSVVLLDPWYYGWSWPWGPSFSIGSWGWSFGWNAWYRPWYAGWYSPWYDPWWGPGWGWGPVGITIPTGVRPGGPAGGMGTIGRRARTIASDVPAPQADRVTCRPSRRAAAAIVRHSPERAAVRPAAAPRGSTITAAGVRTTAAGSTATTTIRATTRGTATAVRRAAAIRPAGPRTPDPAATASTAAAASAVRAADLRAAARAARAADSPAGARVARAAATPTEDVKP